MAADVHEDALGAVLVKVVVRAKTHQIAQQRGLVERRHSPDDKRIVLISLTEKGSRLITQGIKDSVSLIGRLFEELTPEETAVVLRVIDRIPGLLAEHPVERRPRAIRRIPID